MSLFNSLSVGVSGLQAQANSVSIISNNIANGTTVGYKQNTASFSELIAHDPAPSYFSNGVLANNSTSYAPGGVKGGTVQSISLQGEFIASTSATDIAINGDGLIPVSSTVPANGSILYTRAGSFTTDANGNFKNIAGFFLQGWPLDNNGDLAANLATTDVDSATAIAGLVPVNVPQTDEVPVPTANITVQANLDASETDYPGVPPYDATLTTNNMSSGAIPANFTALATVVDSKGEQHTLNIGFLKTAPNVWQAEVYSDPATDVTGALAPQVAAGTVTFNGDGTLASVSPSLSNITISSWADGAASQPIAINWGTAGSLGVGQADGLAQFTGAYTQNVTADGTQSSSLQSVAITDDGYVAATYSNGSTRNVFKIPVAKFIEPNQLQAQTGNVYAQSVDSGVPVFHQSQTGGAGKILSKELEQSNVDLSTQLTSLIVAQNVYTSNSKLVSVTDEMLQTLTQMFS